MTKPILLSLLFLLPSCSETGPGGPSDADLSDVVESFDSSMTDTLAPDTGDEALDGGLADGRLADGGGTLDAGALDAGRLAADTGGGTSSATCGDGFIDPPETCDPAYEGGVHNSDSCRAVAPNACEWCRWGLLSSGGCLYGDYLSEPRTAGWPYACRDSLRNDLSWVTWHSAAERDAVIAAYRSVGASTNVSGWIGYGAGGWVDTGVPWTVEELLPFNNTYTAGRDCVTLTVTLTEAYLRWESCTATTIHGLCVTAPWGTPR